MSGSELPKIVDKTRDDIEAAIAAIESSDLSSGINRGRRTWLFYKTEYGAFIGGVITSVIYTCALG